MLNIFNIKSFLQNKAPETYCEILEQASGKGRSLSDSLTKNEKAIYEAYAQSDKIRLINNGIDPGYKSNFRLESHGPSGIATHDGQLTQLL